MPKEPFKSVLFLFLLVFPLASCLHSHLRTYLDNQVGTMTYEEAVGIWGEPNTLKTEEGLVKASWSDFETGTFNPGQDVFGADGSMPTTHGSRLSLVFEEETKILKSWQHYQW